MTTNTSYSDLLKTKALMVRLTRKKLNRNKLDKSLGEFVSEVKNVSEAGAVRVNKSLFSKAATDPYMKIYSDASKYFYNVTLPWDDRGYRLLSIDLYEEFTKRFKEYTSSYRKAVREFITGVTQHIEESKGILGDAFNITDYKFMAVNGGVDTQMLKDQFALEIEFQPVASGDDLRATLTEADRESIAADIDKKATEKFGKSQEHIVVSLIETVGKIHERLSGADNTFRDTLITNLEDLVNLVPKLNIAGDPDINKLAKKAKVALTKHDPQTLRDDTKTREAVAKEAKDILKQAKGLL